MNVKIIMIFIGLVFVNSCESQTIAVNLSDEEVDSFYDGKIEGNELTPKCFLNRDYKIVSVYVKKDNTIEVDSTRSSKSELQDNLKATWKRIEADEYKGILNIHLRNEREVNYDFYLSIYELIEEAYQNERNELSQNMFQTQYEDISKERRDQIICLIPNLISEAEPDGFD